MGPSTSRVKVHNFFWGLLIKINNFCFEDYVVFWLFFRVVSREVGRSGGRVAGKAKIITNSAQLGLGLGLSLAKRNVKTDWYLPRSVMPQSSQLAVRMEILCSRPSPRVSSGTDSTATYKSRIETSNLFILEKIV